MTQGHSVPFTRHLSLLITALLLTALTLGLWPQVSQAQWFSSSDQGEFLPVQEAFQPSAWHDGDTLYIGMEITEDYYLYRHQFAVQSTDENTTLDAPQLPEGQFITDEFLGDVYVFRDQLVFEVPIVTPHGGPLPISLPIRAVPMPDFATRQKPYPYRPSRLRRQQLLLIGSLRNTLPKTIHPRRLPTAQSIRVPTPRIPPTRAQGKIASAARKVTTVVSQPCSAKPAYPWRWGCSLLLG